VPKIAILSTTDKHLAVALQVGTYASLGRDLETKSKKREHFKMITVASRL
jgi:hypothetical protein